MERSLVTSLSSSSVEGRSQSKVILIRKFSGDGTGETEHIKKKKINVMRSNNIKMSTIWLRIVFRKESLESCLEFVLGARIMSV